MPAFPQEKFSHYITGQAHRNAHKDKKIPHEDKKAPPPTWIKRWQKGPYIVKKALHQEKDVAIRPPRKEKN